MRLKGCNALVYVVGAESSSFVACLTTSTHSVVSLTVFMDQLAVLRTFAASLAK